MPRLGSNGGLMGPRRVSTTSNASGSWLLDEQCDAKRAGIWPTAPDTPASIPLQDIVYSKNEVWWSGFDPAYETPLGNLAFRDGVATSGGAVANDGYIKMDLGQAYMVEKIVIGSWHNGFTPPWAVTNNCDILYSVNGTTWTTAFNLIGEFADVSIKEFDINVEARYIAIKRISSGDYAGVSEFYALAPGQIYDPYWANVSLLLHMDGSNGSTTFTDSSINSLTVTAYGNAQVTTTDPKFGTGALTLDGNGDFLTVGSNSALSFGSGDWTIECFVYLNSGNSNVGLFTFGTSYPSTDLGISVTGSTYTLVGAGAGGVSLGSGTLSTWQHFALCRSGSNLRAFLNGTQLGSTQSGQGSAYDTLQIGYYYSSAFAINAKIDEFRVTKGVARYTADFTPPTAAFPNPPAPTDPIPALSPVFWYDFADESTVTTSGTAITSVTDKGSRGWALSVGGTSPQYVTGINGKKCLDWGASPAHSNFMYHANNDGTPITIGEVYVVVDAAFGGTAGNYAGLLTAHNGNWYVLAIASSLTQDGTGFDQLFINGGTSNKFSGDLFGSPSIDDPAIMRINNSSGNTIFSSSGIQIGNDRNFSNLNRGWSGLIGEYVIFPSFLSPTDRDAVQAWLATKWGITLEGQGNG
jgi:hypothetical protein